MPKALKVIAGAVGVVALIIVPLLFLGGALVLFERFGHYLAAACGWLLVATVVLLLLAPIRVLRAPIAMIIYIFTYVWGAFVWLFSAYICFALWGFTGLIIGLVFLGVGVAPVALLALVVNRHLPDAGWLLLAIAIVFGFRALSLWLSSKAGKHRKKHTQSADSSKDIRLRAQSEGLDSKFSLEEKRQFIESKEQRGRVDPGYSPENMKFLATTDAGGDPVERRINKIRTGLDQILTAKERALLVTELFELQERQREGTAERKARPTHAETPTAGNVISAAAAHSTELREPTNAGYCLPKKQFADDRPLETERGKWEEPKGNGTSRLAEQTFDNRFRHGKRHFKLPQEPLEAIGSSGPRFEMMMLDEEIGPEIVLLLRDSTPFAHELKRLQPFELRLTSGAAPTSLGPVLFLLWWMPPITNRKPFALYEQILNPTYTGTLEGLKHLSRQTHLHVILVGLGEELLDVYEFENNFGFETLVPISESACDIHLNMNFTLAKEEYERTYDVMKLFSGAVVQARPGSEGLPDRGISEIAEEMLDAKVKQLGKREPLRTQAGEYPAVTASSKSNHLPVILSLVLLLLAVLFRFPYWFYILLKTVVCGTAIYLTLQASKAGRTAWAWMMGAMGILYNPVFPVRASRSDWEVINIATVGLLAIRIFVERWADNRLVRFCGRMLQRVTR